VHHVEEVAE